MFTYTYPQPTKKEAQKWANALRSGKYKQAKNNLQKNGGYCCLGVACELFIPKEKQDRILSGDLYGSMPGEQPASPDWLESINRDAMGKLDINLTFLNDDEDYTFDMIADIIELLYVHKAI